MSRHLDDLGVDWSLILYAYPDNFPALQNYILLPDAPFFILTQLCGGKGCFFVVFFSLLHT